jgi:hypothetical protein
MISFPIGMAMPSTFGIVSVCIASVGIVSPQCSQGMNHTAIPAPPRSNGIAVAERVFPVL